MTYQVIKTYGHNEGWSCSFRQWRATSHCKWLHGYSLKIEICFEGDTLDKRNWLIDFGSLKSLKHELETMFDHRLIIAKDDPHYENFKLLDTNNPDGWDVANIRFVDNVGCEAFAMEVLLLANKHCIGLVDRVKVAYVKVSEHEGNSAVAIG